MAVDINKLNQRQLDSLIQKAEERKHTIRHDHVLALREKIQALIKAEGYTFEDVFGRARKTRSDKGKVAAKYRDPSDSTRTWSGRGRQPAWFVKALKSGKKEKDLLIG